MNYIQQLKQQFNEGEEHGYHDWKLRDEIVNLDKLFKVLNKFNKVYKHITKG